MSDNRETVKLIIEIPKEDFKKLVNPYQHNEIWCNRLKRIVMNGTPLDDDSERAEVQAYFDGEAYGWEEGRKALLDDVKAEIQAKEMVETDVARQFYNMALADVIQILDNIGKESEVKPNEN